MRTITLINYDAVVDGKGPLCLGTYSSYGIEQMQIIPETGWDKLTITVTFSQSGTALASPVVVPESGIIDVPAGATAKAISLGKPGMIVFRGVADGVQRISTNVPYVVADHAPVEGDAPAPGPSEWEQFVAQVEQSATNAASSAHQAEASRSAAAESATQAKESAVQAGQSESNAALSATAAAGSAADAAAELKKVQNAGAAQVDAVNKAGNTKLAEINAVNALLPRPTEADAGKLPIAQPDGTYALETVTVDSYTKNESDARYAPIESAIKVSGIGTGTVDLSPTVSWGFQKLRLYGRSSQKKTTGAQLFNAQQYCEQNSEFYQLGSNGGVIQIANDGRVITNLQTIRLTAGTYTIFSELARPQVYANGEYLVLGTPGIPSTFSLDADADVYLKVYAVNATSYPTQEYFVMLNTGSSALPWEPYTGGYPSPSAEYPQSIKIPGETGALTVQVTDGGEQLQQLTISTPTGFPGIPVDSGGNWTDEAGKQWISDVVDFNTGRKSQWLGKTIVDGTENKFTEDSGYWNLPYRTSLNISSKRIIISNYFMPDAFYVNTAYEFIWTNAELMKKYGINSIDELNQLCQQWNAQGNPLLIFYAMQEPVETDISDEQISSYAALKSYSGVTKVLATDCGIEASALAEPTQYIEDKIQSAITQAVTRAVALTGGNT